MQNPSELQQKSIRISTIPMQNPQNFNKNPSESQQFLCRTLRTSTKIHQNLNNSYAEPIRTSTKIHQSQQFLCRTHQNFNKNPSESQQFLCRTHQNFNKNPSESQQFLCRTHQNFNKNQSLNTIHAKFISIKHTRPEPPEHQNPSPLLQRVPECRSYGPESPYSLGRSHMSYI